MDKKYTDNKIKGMNYIINKEGKNSVDQEEVFFLNGGKNYLVSKNGLLGLSESELKKILQNEYKLDLKEIYWDYEETVKTNDKTTIEVKRDTKKRLDHIKADLQSNFDTVVNKLCDVYDDRYRCEIESLKHE